MKIILVVPTLSLASALVSQQDNQVENSQHIFVPKLTYIIPIRIRNRRFLALLFRQIDNALRYARFIFSVWGVMEDSNIHEARISVRSARNAA